MGDHRHERKTTEEIKDCQRQAKLNGHESGGGKIEHTVCLETVASVEIQLLVVLMIIIAIITLVPAWLLVA